MVLLSVTCRCRDVLSDGEFHSFAVETVDVGAGSVALKVETILLGAAGDDEVLNNLAVDGIDGEVSVEGKVGGNHQIVGSGVGIAGGSGVGGVVVDAKIVGVNLVDHAVAAGEDVAAGSLNAACGREGEETVARAAPTPTDIEFVVVGRGGTGNDKGMASSVTACASGIIGTVVDRTTVVVKFFMEQLVPLAVGVALTLDENGFVAIVKIFVESSGNILTVGTAAVSVRIVSPSTDTVSVPLPVTCVVPTNCTDFGARAFAQVADSMPSRMSTALSFVTTCGSAETTASPPAFSSFL